MLKWSLWLPVFGSVIAGIYKLSSQNWKQFLTK